MTIKRYDIIVPNWLRLAALSIICLYAPTSYAQKATPAYQVRAAFLYNFSHFVEWPAGSFRDGNAPFVIGILGDDPFGSFLDDLVSGEKANEHPIIIERYADINSVKNCHILYINTNLTEEVLAQLGRRKILLVSDAEQFTKKGGMIRFFTQNNKTRLQINPGTVRAAGLVISSKLLRVSELDE